MALSAPFCPLANLLNPDQSGRWLVGAVGIELKATLKARNLLIPLNAKNAKNTRFAQVRYTRGTRTPALGQDTISYVYFIPRFPRLPGYEQ